MVVKIFRFSIISLAVVGVLSYLYFPSLSRLKELKEIEKDLDNKIFLLKSEINDLKREIKLADSAEYKKYLIRKKLNLLKEGEYILEIKNSGVEQPGSSPGS